MHYSLKPTVSIGHLFSRCKVIGANDRETIRLKQKVGQWTGPKFTIFMDTKREKNSYTLFISGRI